MNVSQGFNGIGTTISPIIASYAFFGGDDTQTDNLDSVKWCYVGVGCGMYTQRKDGYLVLANNQ